MPRPPTLCEANFRTAAPPGLYGGLLERLDNQYRAAYRHMQGGNFREGAANILLPHYRRGLIESELEDLAHRLGLNSRITQFEGNSDDFVTIELPGGIELIVCYVKDKDAPVRYARKREELTHASNMQHLEFLDFVPRPQVLVPTAAFAILTHTADENDPGRLGTANVIFPSPSAGYSLGSLDLHQEAERVAREQAAAAVQAKRKVEVKLKKGGNES